jgi:uncharacterized membrane protein YgcG
MRHRTALITAASIAAVVFAGAIAVGANLGILTVADSAPAGVGQLTTATVVRTSGTKATTEYVGASKAAAARDTQSYVIKKAGSVKVAFSKTSVRLVDVSAKHHYTWKLAQTGDNKLTVTFKKGSDTYTFVASVADHGKLTARVDHPITNVTPAASSGSSASWAVAPAPSPSSSSGGGGSHEGGGQDD